MEDACVTRARECLEILISSKLLGLFYFYIYFTCVLLPCFYSPLVTVPSLLCIIFLNSFFLLFLSCMAVSKLCTGCFVTMDKTGSDFYSGGARFISRPLRRIPWQRKFFYSFCGQMPWQNLNFGSDCFLLCPLQFIVHYRSAIRRCIISVTDLSFSKLQIQNFALHALSPNRRYCFHECNTLE